MTEIPTSAKTSSYLASSYVRKTMQKGENQPVFFALSRWQYATAFFHLSLFIAIPLFVIKALVALFVVGVSFAIKAPDLLNMLAALPQPLTTILSFVLLQACYLIIVRFQRAATEYAVSNKRVVMKIGILSRHTDEVRPEAIEAVTVNQGILGRMFNFGDCIVRGRGVGSLRMAYVIDPLKVKTQIEQYTS